MSYTVHPNPWCEWAEGKQCYTLPLCIYCDDTSVNNQRNAIGTISFLFTLASLDAGHAHLLYNIHSPSTSDIASPTENLENLTQKMMWVHSTLHGKNCNVAGFYLIVDCILLGSLVMILYIMKIFIKWVLSFCGNNPMQSEIAAHMGLAGKCFCHIYMWRVGKDKSNVSPSMWSLNLSCPFNSLLSSAGAEKDN